MNLRELEYLMTSRTLLPIVLALTLVLAACSRERQDWKAAQAADTAEAYTDFVKKHPEGELATQAQTRLAQIVDERDWQFAASADTPEAYQRFVQLHPGSKWAEEARIRIESFALGAQPASSSASPSAPASVSLPTAPTPEETPVIEPALDAPAAAPAPEPAPAPSKPAAAPRSTSYGIQLGAFGTEQKARSEWQRLESANADLLGGLSSSVASVQGGTGTLWRLRASTASEAKSRSLCASLTKRGVSCVVVLPGGVAK